MKKCPKCNRTYADDGFTFCLEDGALLSASYEADKEAPTSTLQSSGPPPTLVLPENRSAHHVTPTVLGSGQSSERSVSQNSRTKTARRIVIGLIAAMVVIFVLGFAGFYFAGKSNCPKLEIHCYPSSATSYCDVAQQTAQTTNGASAQPISAALCSRTLILLQAAPLPKNIGNITWSASAGALSSNHSQMTLNTAGLAGQTVTVTARVTSASWICSTTLSTSFVVP
jgi:hypothetical protein